MISKFHLAPLRLTSAILLALCSACSGGGNSGVDNNPESTNNGIISNDEVSNPAVGDERELIVSDSATTTKTITQCFCDVRYRSTLQFYHFANQNAVLLIEFDNTSKEFSNSATVVVFESDASTESVLRWINNQHSDGLYIDSATPLARHAIAPDNISITSSAFVENLSGNVGDEYEQHQIDYTVANLSEPGSFFLSGFTDQTVVYLQTR